MTLKDFFSSFFVTVPLKSQIAFLFAKIFPNANESFFIAPPSLPLIDSEGPVPHQIFLHTPEKKAGMLPEHLFLLKAEI